METVVALASLVTRFPTLADMLFQFLRLVESLEAQARTTAGPDLSTVEGQVEDAADRLVREGLGRVLLALEPDGDLVEVNGVRYRRMTYPTPGVYFARRGRVRSRNSPASTPSMSCLLITSDPR